MTSSDIPTEGVQSPRAYNICSRFLVCCLPDPTAIAGCSDLLSLSVFLLHSFCFLLLALIALNQWLAKNFEKEIILWCLVQWQHTWCTGSYFSVYWCVGCNSYLFPFFFFKEGSISSLFEMKWAYSFFVITGVQAWKHDFTMIFRLTWPQDRKFHSEGIDVQ